MNVDWPLVMKYIVALTVRLTNNFAHCVRLVVVNKYI